ncbi:MAG: ABC transporter ATP-binding protein [Bdellovibrionales bacterium]|jgi:oligopeptide/dipeptide ABC transporter ATP-binding protein|nr:ABC transporter ATP-binding protein [Bdellovibrionales bacterium]
MAEKILEVKDLVVQFNTDRGLVTAVNGVNFEVHKGRTIGIVGESGSGKSVSALAIMQLIPSPPGKIAGGQIEYKGESLLDKSDAEMRKIRGNKIAMIFQEPMTSLNPVFTVGNQIEEVLTLHQSELSKNDRRKKAVDLLGLVGIPSPDRRYKEYPHQLSGGMRQRVMIAMSLACEPDILIADEPTTALDVTIQAQILELMNKLQKELGMGIIMITHDLGVVAETCDDVAVMYCGKIVEKSDVKTIFNNPKHPYTIGLLNSIPSFDSTSSEEKSRLPTIEGMVPSLFDLPKGCSFQDRCDYSSDKCINDQQLQLVAKSHMVSCCHPQ